MQFKLSLEGEEITPEKMAQAFKLMCKQIKPLSSDSQGILHLEAVVVAFMLKNDNGEYVHDNQKYLIRNTKYKRLKNKRLIWEDDRNHLYVYLEL